LTERPGVSGRYYTLDAMRGIAAIAVLFMHLSYQWGLNLAPGGNLAVDFFFALSGFVLTKAYAARFAAGMTVADFIGLRLLRLYPLFALGCAFGIIKVAFQIAMHDVNAPSMLQLLSILVANPLILPAPGVTYLFPLNIPAWSLFLEVVANIVFAAVFVRARLRSMLLVMLVSAIVLSCGVYLQGDIELGPKWTTLPFGLARVGYGFTCGVVLASVFDEQSRRRSFAAVIAVLLLACLLAIPLAGNERILFECAAAIVLMPVMLWLGSRFEMPAALLGVSAFLGDISYPLYAIHFPLVTMFGQMQKRLLHVPLLPLYLTFAALLIGMAWLAAGMFDNPVRRRMTAWLRSRHVAGLSPETPDRDAGHDMNSTSKNKTAIDIAPTI
jgi:peptidoglycan/LPS O-acetylase OafA/YrhL